MLYNVLKGFVQNVNRGTLGNILQAVSRERGFGFT